MPKVLNSTSSTNNLAAKQAAVMTAMQQIQKQYGTGSIMRLGERTERLSVETIPTGSIALDLALGVGGVPKGRIVEIFGPEASGKCLKFDTLVLTEFGLLPIGYFGNLTKFGFQPKNIKLFSEDGVATTSHFYNSGVKRTIKIRTTYGYELEGTPNHRIRIINENGNYVYRRLDELKTNDKVAIQRGQYYFGKGVDLSSFADSYQDDSFNSKDYDPPKFINEDLARIMGYLTGDGSCTQLSSIAMTIADKEIIEDFIKLCIRIFNEQPRIVWNKKHPNVGLFQIYNRKARAFLAYAGLTYETAAHKHIPYSILQAPKEVLAQFISGLFETDGTFSKNTIEYCTKSFELVHQVQMVLLNFGIVAKIKERIHQKYPKNTYFYLYIDGYLDQKIFWREINFISQRKSQKLFEHICKPRTQYQSNRDAIPFINDKIYQLMKDYAIYVAPTNRAHWDIVYDYLLQATDYSAVTYPRLFKILNPFEGGEKSAIYEELSLLHNKNIFWDKLVEISPSESLVVDFTVPETHSFFGNGFINHNTTIALHVIAEAQKKGGVAAFIDAEHALDPQRTQKIGVNLDELLISQPDTGEQALEIADALIRSGGIDVIVIDSVAALVPKAEIEGEMGDAVMGMQARLMSQALRKLTGAISVTNTLVIFTNQLRQKIGVMFGNPETTTGGMALKFYSSIRLDVRKIENIKQGDQVVGSRHRVKIVKNKVAPPFRIAEFDMDEKGISHGGELLDVGIELGILAKSGAFIRWGETLLGQGRPAATVWLQENPKEAERLEKEIRDKWNEQRNGKEPIVVGEEETSEIEEAV